MMIKSIKKVLRECYMENPRGFWRGFKNSIVIILALVCILVVTLFHGGGRRVNVYEVKATGITYRTSESNPRKKEPTELSTTYLIVEE